MSEIESYLKKKKSPWDTKRKIKNEPKKLYN